MGVRTKSPCTASISGPPRRRTGQPHGRADFSRGARLQERPCGVQLRPAALRHVAQQPRRVLRPHLRREHQRQRALHHLRALRMRQRGQRARLLVRRPRLPRAAS